jgi:hypothetical protein
VVPVVLPAVLEVPPVVEPLDVVPALVPTPDELPPVPLLVLPPDPEPVDPEPLDPPSASTPIPVPEPCEPHMASPTGSATRSGSVRRRFTGRRAATPMPGRRANEGRLGQIM